MSGFLANGSPTKPFPITNDDFWPDIDGNNLRAAIRMDGSVSDVRLEVATVNALIEVNAELEQLKASHLVSGHITLADVPAPQVQGQSKWVWQYKRAIYCTAGAELAERYRSYDSTAEGSKNADELTPSVDEFRRDARFAIRNLLGIGHSTIDLI
ncbi:head completion/stabilization protein [Pseudomonas sp. UBA4194]|uniref:head completion/stabilization protein n=1 Tax=Pseudomonas sp. UBA4194 TaxID=1947317 RepID=UPI0025E27828|nr:head completion/stabilization protein [Pseudomonas sp. UBA4194]